MKPNLETTLKLNDLFGKLDPEKRVEIIKPKEVKRNETLDRIVEGYEKGLENYGLYEEDKLKIEIPEGEYWYYYIAKSSAPSEIQSKEITEFSLLLEEHENKKYFENFTGYYLSALINSSRDKDFKIITNYLTKTIDWIGYENTKNIVVTGNAGWGVGNRMEDGEITVNGNAGWWVGWNMKDGKITINGNAGYGVGNRMEDGEIHLNGDYESLGGYISGGNIYHKGKLIVRDGRRLI